jgi:hypothetical protein
VKEVIFADIVSGNRKITEIICSGFVKFYMRHGIQVAEVKAILSFVAVTPDLDQVGALSIREISDSISYSTSKVVKYVNFS